MCVCVYVCVCVCVHFYYVLLNWHTGLRLFMLPSVISDHSSKKFFVGISLDQVSQRVFNRVVTQ